MRIGHYNEILICSSIFSKQINHIELEDIRMAAKIWTRRQINRLDILDVALSKFDFYLTQVMS